MLAIVYIYNRWTKSEIKVIKKMLLLTQPSLLLSVLFLCGDVIELINLSNFVFNYWS